MKRMDEERCSNALLDCYPHAWILHLERLGKPSGSRASERGSRSEWLELFFGLLQHAGAECGIGGE